MLKDASTFSIYSLVFKDASTFSNILIGVQGCKYILKHTHWCSRMQVHSQTYSLVLKDASTFSNILGGVQGCKYILNILIGVQGCKYILNHTWRCSRMQVHSHLESHKEVMSGPLDQSFRWLGEMRRAQCIRLREHETNYRC